MRFAKIKFAFFALAIVFLLFFSNDFGLIDIEKTAIITAVAVDITEDGEYKVTAQIAVPEATDTNTENQRAQISGKGATVGAAIKNIGDTSGWFPQLCFCNLIAVGNGFSDYNLIKVLDYFSKTLRVQDTALIVMAEEDGEELLKLATPLDNISSFALQKIILKNAGLNRDVAVSDIKSFCTGYYSDAGASILPVIKVVSQKKENENASAENGAGGTGGNSGNGGNGGNGGQSGSGAKGDAIFNANTTALFLHGVKVGELDENLTLAFNALTKDFSNTTFQLKSVVMGTGTENFLLTVFSCNADKKLEVSASGITLKVCVDIYAKISDRNGENTDLDFVKNLPMPYYVKERAEKDFTAYIEDLIRTAKTTKCDFLDIKKELYRKHYSFYHIYKNDYLERLTFTVKVNFSGQK
ncbi:MAG: hypothetical protein J5911_04760 [Clostridia bacterium]|nr:hypothetical protein [Clostridia bacterium]